MSKSSIQIMETKRKIIVDEYSSSCFWVLLIFHWKIYNISNTETTDENENKF